VRLSLFLLFWQDTLFPITIDLASNQAKLIFPLTLTGGTQKDAMVLQGGEKLVFLPYTL